MTNITFTAAYPSTDEEALQFALAKGWRAKLTVPNPDFDPQLTGEDFVPAEMEIDNPQTYIEFITEGFRKLASDWLFEPTREGLNKAAAAQIAAINETVATEAETRLENIKSALSIDFN